MTVRDWHAEFIEFCAQGMIIRILFCNILSKLIDNYTFNRIVL